MVFIFKILNFMCNVEVHNKAQSVHEQQTAAMEKDLLDQRKAMSKLKRKLDSELDVKQKELDEVALEAKEYFEQIQELQDTIQIQESTCNVLLRH